MKRLNSILSSVVQILSMFIVFGLCGTQAQADAQNSITALNVSSAGDGSASNFSARLDFEDCVGICRTVPFNPSP